MKRLWEAMKGNRLLYIIGLAGVAGSFSLRMVFLAKIMKDLFNAAVSGTVSDLVTNVTMGVVYFLALTLIQPVFFYLLRLSNIRTSVNVREKLYTKVKNLPIKYFKAEHSGNLISKLSNDVAEFEKAYRLYFTRVIQFGAGGVGALIYMFMLDARLATISLITGSIGLIVATLYAKPLRRIAKQVQDRLGFLTENFSDIYAGVHVIKSFNLYNVILDKYMNKNEDVYEASIKRVKRNAELQTFNNVARWLDILGYLVVGAYFAINGWVSLGVIIAISQLKNPVMFFFAQIGQLITNLQTSLASGDRIWSVLDEPNEPELYENMSDANNLPTNCAVKVENVNFGYDADEKVINHLGFEVEAGKKVALVGPSGGGKSTIFKLLMGFYPPEGGQIVVHGKSLGSEKLKSVREQIAYVPQNAYLFSGTIKENIMYGNEGASEEDIIKAAKVANADKFIQAFEDGYDTIVGERGAQLSGGQRQRVAIARAVLTDAPILLLDEATSSLDTESEQLVQEALDRLARDRTTLVIAHRFSTVQDSDKIMVIDNGEVKESGTHDELLAMDDGIYQKLYKQQFDGVA